MGSSPLARGLPQARACIVICVGIIPARAGFTPAASAPQATCPDHPRSRGVYSAWAGFGSSVGGSSPLARGLRLRVPPCAIRVMDHPRSRGVYITASLDAMSKGGSSPLARGLLRAASGCPRRIRIIPARAGFTGAAQIGDAAIGDHPRSRGVYLYWISVCHRPAGSSPLARGLHYSLVQCAHRTGIIPARAGFTSCCHMSRGYCMDHPRSRGVYHSTLRRRRHPTGSSPLARGLPVTEYAASEMK